MDKNDIRLLVQKAIDREPLRGDIRKVSLFGSFLSGHSRNNSDIDLLIEFNPSARIGFFRFIGIQEGLEKSLGKKVDLLTPEALSEYFREEICKNAEVIYEK